MRPLTKKYIFECKLKGEPVVAYTSVLYHRGILGLLTIAGVWEKDPLYTKKFWKEYSFTILYPIKIIDSDGTVLYLCKGDHHIVCL